jgi:hypothetical protein
LYDKVSTNRENQLPKKRYEFTYLKEMYAIEQEIIFVEEKTLEKYNHHFFFISFFL